MKLSRLLLCIGLLCALHLLPAQDIHYTLYNMSPLTINPALTGAYEGTARIGGIYRNQWYAVTDMSTPSFYLDAPIIRGFRNQDWVGIGLMFYSDNAGLLKLQTTASALSASYHLGLDKEGQTRLTLGAQYNRGQRKIDPQGSFVAEENISTDLGGLGQTSTEFDETSNKTYTDINVGLMLRTVIAEGSALELGFSAYHVNEPRYNLSTGVTGGGGTPGGVDPNRRPRTYIAHGTLDYQLDEKWSVAPTFLWQTTTGGSNEINLQAWMGRQINEEVLLKFGLGYRFRDAAKLLFGINYGDLRAALSYDINVSAANPITNYQGGFELAAYYILKIYKKPDVTPSVICPRF